MDDKERIYRGLIIQLMIRCCELYYQNRLRKNTYGSYMTKITNAPNGNYITIYPQLNGGTRTRHTEEYLKAYA